MANTNTTTPVADNQATTVKTGDQIAQDMGYTDATDLLNQVVANLNSQNVVLKANAQAAAATFTSKLILLVLYQTIDNYYNLAPYAGINKFESEKIEAGNTKQYIRNIITGGDTFDPNQFIPSKVTNPQVETTTISLYERNATTGEDELTKYGFKYKKPLTIQNSLGLPYFTSGKLQEFIESIIKLVNDSFEIFRITIIQNMINDVKADTSTIKKITGTASNILDCFTNEIYPEIVNMAGLSSNYNINLNGTATSLNSSSKEDLLIFVNNKTYTKLNSGVMSQLYNYELADIPKYINNENIIPTAELLVSGDSDTPISVSATPLINENEILVLNKNSIKQLFGVNQNESQSGATNMSLEIVLHVGGAFGFIPGGQGFLYTNENLKVSN